MQLGVVGVSHHRTPVEIRERFVFGPDEVEPSLVQLIETPGIREAVLLSTCNRTEFYVVGDADALEEAAVVLASRAGDPLQTRHLVHLRQGREAVEHLFRVVSGLDSMVVGEAQIQGQVRTGYERGQHASSVGPVLARLFERALSIGALVRTSTGIGQRAGNVATGVLEVARKIFGSLAGKRAVLIGAGEMSDLVAQVLVSQQAQCTVVASRTEASARALAERHGIQFARFEDLARVLRDAELLVSATAAPHPVVTHATVAAALQGRRQPLLIVDLALPRDVEPEVADLEAVFLYDMDDLRPVVERREAWWQGEMSRAEAMIESAVGEFHDWYRSRSAVPIIRSLRERVEEVRRAELDRMLRRMPHLAEADRQAVERLTVQLVAKVLHAPMVRLRDAARNEDEAGAEMLEAAQYLFQLDVEEAHESGWDEESGVA